MAKGRAFWILLFTLIALLIGIAFGFYGGFVYFAKEVSFSLKGDAVVNLENGEEYIEEGVLANIYGVDYSDEVKIAGEVNCHVEGNYTITYTLNHKPINQTLTRLVMVGEGVDPSGFVHDFFLKGRNKVYLYPNEDYIDEGFETTLDLDIDTYYYDEYMRPLDEITYDKEGIYYIKYLAIDGEESYVLTREIEVINSSLEKPYVPDNIVFSLKGFLYRDVYLFSEYIEDGYTAVCNGTIINDYVTRKVYKNGSEVENINTNVIGEYVIKYTLKYLENEEINLYRYVSVKELQSVNDDLSIHIMELGNKYAGDSIYIKAGETDILIDAGSRQGSATIIKEYIDNYCTDNKLEYVIATHADQDHIAAFYGNKDGDTRTGLLYTYQVDMIIDFPKTNKTTQIYQNYQARVSELVTMGTAHYTALECVKELNGAKKKYEVSNGIIMEFLYQKFYEESSSDENNYSVCTLFTQNEKNHYLFTGDLEEKGEESLISSNELPEVDFFKAGHHGSPTSTNSFLLEVIKPKICAVCCVAGSTEYTSVNDNTFPSQAFITRISKWTDKVYVTSLVDGTSFKAMNGSIVITTKDGNVVVNCSNNNILLKDSEWFRDNRVWG